MVAQIGQAGEPVNTIQLSTVWTAMHLQPSQMRQTVNDLDSGVHMESKQFSFDYLSRYRLIPACSHLAICAIVWFAAAMDPRPVLDGVARWGIWLLTLVDFPLSVIAFSLMWDERRLLGGFVWSCGGTLLWYLLGGVFFRSKLNRQDPRKH